MMINHCRTLVILVKYCLKGELLIMIDMKISKEIKFGSPTSDSERAMIGESSKEIVMCIYSFSGDEGLEEYLSSAKELLEK